MNKYELLYVVSTKLEEEKREELITRFAGLVTAAGGEVEVSKWGVKKLAYPIKFQSEGFYVQMNFSAPESLPIEIERQLRLLDYVLRFMTVKKIENKHTLKAAAKKEALRKAKAEAAAAEAAAFEKAEAEKAAAAAEAAKEAEKAEPAEVAEATETAEKPEKVKKTKKAKEAAPAEEVAAAPAEEAQAPAEDAADAASTEAVDAAE